MSPRDRTRISKFLSRHLRHAPEDLGLTLEPGGWVPIADLLTALAKARFPLTRDELNEVVEADNKQRYSYDEPGVRIRANQGHSTPVDLQLEPVIPPAVLYHGTSADRVASILQDGLSKMARHHVHLSADTTTATRVGSRHGSAVLLSVDAAGMSEAGLLFYQSANGVWLTDEVPPAYLSRL